MGPLRLDALSVFWYLLRFPGLRVRVAAALAIFLCVVYALGLGGLVLLIAETAASRFGIEWFPHNLSPWLWIGLGTGWVIVFAGVFATFLFHGFLPRALSRREWNADQVIEATEQLAAKYRSDDDRSSRRPTGFAAQQS